MKSLLVRSLVLSMFVASAAYGNPVLRAVGNWVSKGRVGNVALTTPSRAVVGTNESLALLWFGQKRLFAFSPKTKGMALVSSDFSANGPLHFDVHLDANISQPAYLNVLQTQPNFGQALAAKLQRLGTRIDGILQQNGTGLQTSGPTMSVLRLEDNLTTKMFVSNRFSLSREQLENLDIGAIEEIINAISRI